MVYRGGWSPWCARRGSGSLTVTHSGCGDAARRMCVDCQEEPHTEDAGVLQEGKRGNMSEGGYGSTLP